MKTRRDKETGILLHWLLFDPGKNNECLLSLGRGADKATQTKKQKLSWCKLVQFHWLNGNASFSPAKDVDTNVKGSSVIIFQDKDQSWILSQIFKQNFSQADFADPSLIFCFLTHPKYLIPLITMLFPSPVSTLFFTAVKKNPVSPSRLSSVH